jgi:hypothetical protein
MEYKQSKTIINVAKMSTTVHAVKIYSYYLGSLGGRTIAQEVSRWLPNAVVRGSSPGLVMWDFVVDKVPLGQAFSEYFGFPCQSSFHQLLHNDPHLSSGVCTIGQKWAQYLGTESHPTNNKK